MNDKKNSIEKFYMYKNEQHPTNQQSQQQQQQSQIDRITSNRMMSTMTRSTSYQCTPMDFIQTIFETGHFALFNFNMKEDIKGTISITMGTSSSSQVSTHIDSIKSFLISQVSVLLSIVILVFYLHHILISLYVESWL